MSFSETSEEEFPEPVSTAFLEKALFYSQNFKLMITENQNFQMIATDHTQLSGMASYYESKYFLFSPDEPVAGMLPRFRCQGIAQQMTDGTFDFVAKPKLKPQSQLIKKLAHGRVSKTKDGAIQLTLKVYQDEGENIAEAIYKEAGIARDAIIAYQMKR